jgi:hypothetical protein
VVPVTARTWLLAALVVGCSRHHGLPPAIEGQRTVLDAALHRPIPPRLQGKLTVKVRSDALGLAGSTGGALFLDRPGRAHLAVFGPLGGPLVTLQTDGVGLAVALTRDRRHLVADDAAAVVARATGGALSLDDLLGLLQGELPFAEADLTDAERLPDGALALTVRAPKGARARVVLDDRAGTPLSLDVSAKNDVPLLSATWGPFAPLGDGGPLVPTVVALQVPALDLDLELKARSWTVPEAMPDVFGMAPPEGFTTGPLEGAFGVAPP